MSSAKLALLRASTRICHLALGALMVFAVEVAALDLYKWTDGKGVVHYSDKPPQGVNAERVKTKPQRAPVENVEDPQAVTDPDAERCKAERERLTVLQSNSRVQMSERDGTVRELTPEQIQEEIGFSQKAIARFCKS